MDDLKARLITAHNPVAPADGRQVRTVGAAPGTSVGALIRSNAAALGAGPCVVVLNDRAVPRAQLDETWVRDGDCLSVCAAAAGDDSDVRRAVLFIIVAIASYYTAGQVGAAYGSTAGAAAGAAVSIGGAYLVNSLVPPRQPDLTRDSGPNGNPTYAIASTRNRMRPYEPMQVLVGEHRMWPDTAAKPYTFYDGRDQFLVQVFSFGVTDLELGDVLIGDTPIENFDDIELEISGPDGKLSRFPTNVDTIAGASLIGGADWIQRTTSVDTKEISVDVTGNVYAIGKKGPVALEVDIEGEYRLAGSGDPWQSFLYGQDFVSRTHYWSKGYWNGLSPSQWVQLDFDSSVDENKYVDDAKVGEITIRLGKVLGNGTYDVIWRWRSYVERQDEGQPIHKSGQRILDPAPPEQYRTTVPHVVLRNDSTEPVRRTFTFEVEKGQYEVRMRRTTPEHTADDQVSSIAWASLKSFQPDDGDYEGQKRVAFRIRASGQLNGPIDRFSAVGRGRIPVRQDDGTWATEYTRNPGWWFIHVALGRFRDDGTRLYGGGLDLARINIDGLEEWADWCETKGLECDAVFNRGQSCDDMLRLIAQCGRARISWATGKLGVVWDEPGEPQAVFGMSNIVAGSFRVSYVTEKLPSAIEARYVDPRIGWQLNTLRVPVPFSQNDAQPASIEFKGLTDESLVAAAANLLAADQYYHRRRISWETDMEGLMVTVGDVVLLAHDLTNWDYSGRLIASDTVDAILSREIEFTAGEDHYLIAVQPDGTMTAHLVRNDGGTTDQVHFEDPLPADPGADAIDWRFLFGPVAEPGKRVKLISTRPVTNDRVQITAVDEVQEYYDAADGTWEPAPLPDTPPVGRISNLAVSETLLDDNDRVRLLVSWDLADAPLAVLRYRVNERSWEVRPATDVGSAAIDARVGDVVTVQVRPVESASEVLLVNLQIEGGKEVVHTVTGREDPPPDVMGFEINTVGATTYLRWDDIEELDHDHYELRYSSKTSGAKWAESIPLRPNIARNTTEVAVPAQVGTYLIKAFDRADAESVNASLIVSNIAEVEGLNVVETRQEDPGFTGAKTDLVVHEGTLQLAPADGIDSWASLDDVKRLDYYGAGVVPEGLYVFSETVDLQNVFTCRVSADMTLTSIDFLNTLDQWTSLADVTSLSSNTGAYEAELEVRTTQDDPAGAPAWSAWAPAVVGDYTGRAFQFRLWLRTNNPAVTPILSALSVRVDMPDRVVGEHNVTCPAAGLRVTFDPAFLAVPAVGFGHQDLLESDRVEITSQDRTGFDIRYFNSGAGVERTFDYVARGYGRETS